MSSGKPAAHHRKMAIALPSDFSLMYKDASPSGRRSEAVSDTIATIEADVTRLFESQVPAPVDAIRILLAEFRAHLNRGLIRSAERQGDTWRLHPWVRKGILLHREIGRLVDVSPLGDGSAFDLDTLPLRTFAPHDAVRAMSGSHIRDGSYLGAGVVCMPYSIVNMGAYVGAE